MDTIKLNSQYSLGVVVENKRLRLIVFDRNEELICNKTSVSELKRFLEQSEAHLFKGRLQLHKSGNDVAVLMKGEVAGIISRSALTAKLTDQVASLTL